MDQSYEVKLLSYAYGGEALGRLPDGRAVFVPLAVPGESVRVRLVEEKRGHARAELLEVLEPASQRVAPRCIHFGECGGCHYQHLSYSAQLQAKRQILVDQLERIGGISQPPVADTVPCPSQFNYRNYVQFHMAQQGKLAFHRLRSGDLLPVQECHLPEIDLNLVWPQLAFEDQPDIERIGLRLGESEVQLILESSNPDTPEFDVEDISLSAVHIGPGGSVVLAGGSELVMRVLDRPFRVQAASFFQVNTSMAESLVRSVLDGLQERNVLGPQATLLDIYCGVGLFSAFLSPLAGRLIGIEASPSACEDYAANLDEYENVELYEAPAEEVLPGLEVVPSAALVDPPRAGMERRALDGLLRIGPPVIAYISCDPATLARDARRLVAGGYRLEEAIPFDLFPQTYHIECLSWWRKINSL